MSETDVPFRILPQVGDRNRFFWESGADGKLRFLRCPHDGWYVHPPSPICPKCYRKDLVPEEVSGRAEVHTYTINHQAWMPFLDVPFILAIVELPEQQGLRLTTNIVGIGVDEVQVGMPVQVRFERHEDGDEVVYIPIFEPVAGE
jgi:uncharacterized OB-fold protein